MLQQLNSAELGGCFENIYHVSFMICTLMFSFDQNIFVKSRCNTVVNKLVLSVTTIKTSIGPILVITCYR